MPMRLLLKMTAAAPCSTAFADLDETIVQSVLLFGTECQCAAGSRTPFSRLQQGLKGACKMKHTLVCSCSVVSNALNFPA